MTIGVLTAGSGHGWETDFVAALDRPGSAMTVLQRCADLADVLAEAATGRATACILAADLRRLDSDAVTRLRLAGVAMVVVHSATDARAAARLERIGIEATIADDAGAETMIAAVRSAVAGTEQPSDGESAGEPAGRAAFGTPAGSDRTADRTVSDPRRSLRRKSSALPRSPAAGSRAGSADPGPAEARAPGSVIAVWGPAGAPGRTTLALGIADEMSQTGCSTLLIDADVYGGVLASALGLLDESPGLAGACRLAANGRLDSGELAKLSWSITPELSLLTGIARTDRWPEVRPSSIASVLSVATSQFAIVVLDCSFCVESDEEITFDTVAPRRNGATLAALGAADVVLAVGSADPAGMERLVRGLAELADAVPEALPRVVLNRVRRSAASSDELSVALRRFAAKDVFATLPEDRDATDICWRRGVPLSAAAPRSALRSALAELASRLAAELTSAAPASTGTVDAVRT